MPTKEIVYLSDRVKQLWDKFDAAEINTTDARIHVSFARTLIDIRRVEIAAAHVLGLDHIPSLNITGPIERPALPTPKDTGTATEK